jgi:hypothetical protein
MTPVQMIRVGLDDEALQIPLFRLPYSGGQDSDHKRGGFFTTKEGEFGVVVDVNTTIEEAQKIVAEEIQRNAHILALVLRRSAEVKKKDKSTRAHS